MRLSTTTCGPGDWRGDVLALGVFADELPEPAWVSGLPAPLAVTVRAALALPAFSALPGDVVTGAGGLVLVGLGAAAESTPDRSRWAGALVARSLAGRPCGRVGVWIPASPGGKAGDVVEFAAEGFALAVHEGRWNLLPDRFKAGYGDDLPPEPEEVEFLACEPDEDLFARTTALTHAILLSRELVAAPGNLITPSRLAEEAGALAKTGGLDLAVLDERACAELGLSALLAAGRGAANPPCLLHLTYRPAGPVTRRVAVIGLGITFDDRGAEASGAVEGAKKSMAAAGSVLGAAAAVAALGTGAEVHFLIPAAEKTAGPGSLRVGDLVTTASGATVEVNGPDAHGRLMLADTLWYAGTLGVTEVVSMATLGFSCAAALGPRIAGLWSTEDGLAAGLDRAGTLAGEPLWRLPLFDAYTSHLWAPFANYRSNGPAVGDASSTALFLRAFAPPGAWAHLEITAPAWSGRVDGYYNAGATGFGAGTLARWLLGQ